MSTTVNEIRTFTRKGQGSWARAHTRSKGKVVSVEHLIHLENALHGPKSVINVEIRIILVLNVGPNSREEGTDDPAAHPEDVRTKTNVNSPGPEVTRGPKVHIA